MARPQKDGLDYFPLDVDIDQDDKVQLIEAEYGIIGFAIVIKLLMKIYKEGYYYEWTEKEQLLFSKKVNVDINQVNGIINACLKWGLFDKTLYDKYKILTSKGIQRRYLEAVSRRKQIVFIKDFFLLDVSKYQNIVFDNINQVNDDNNSINDDNNPQSKVKESKEKKSKVNKINYAEYVSMTNDEYQKILDAYGEEATKRMIEILDNYKGSTGKKYKSDYRTILNWVVQRYLEEKNKQGGIENDKKYAVNSGNIKRSYGQSYKISGQEKHEDKLFSRGLD
jgi:hypothetical protein